MTVLQDVLGAHDLAEKLNRHAESCDTEGLRARLVRVDGTTELVYLSAHERHVEEINDLIGSHSFDCVQVVTKAPGKPGLDAWIDDDGLFSREPNVVASAMLRWFTGEPHAIHGDVLFTGGPDSEGDTLALTRIQDAILSDIATELAEKARLIHLI